MAACEEEVPAPDLPAPSTLQEDAEPQATDTSFDLEDNATEVSARLENQEGEESGLSDLDGSTGAHSGNADGSGTEGQHGSGAQHQRSEADESTHTGRIEESDHESLCSMARRDGFEWVERPSRMVPISIATPPSEIEQAYFPNLRLGSSIAGTSEAGESVTTSDSARGASAFTTGIARMLPHEAQPVAAGPLHGTGASGIGGGSLAIAPFHSYPEQVDAEHVQASSPPPPEPVSGREPVSLPAPAPVPAPAAPTGSAPSLGPAITAASVLAGGIAAAAGAWFTRRRACQCRNQTVPGTHPVTPYRILLLGQTGSGKTKLLDLLCNWAKLRPLLHKGKSSQLIDRLEPFHTREFESAKDNNMSSKTDRASRYPIGIGDMKLEIIDSPGFADTRGLEFDDRHICDIIDCLKEVEFLNCILLVINGRAARMTNTLKYVLTQVCSIMPRTILQQVFVVFTNTTNDLQLNFDITQLRPYLNDDVDQRYIVLENPLASMEKAVQKTSRIPKTRLSEALGSTLDQAFGALTEMVARIRQFPCVHTNDFVKLFSARQRVELRTMDLLAEYDHITQHISSVRSLEAEIQAAMRQKSLYKDFKTTQKMLKRRTVQTSRHNTLCGHPGCYSNCHVPCHLPKSMDKEVFKHCAAMGRKQHCQVCGHSFKHHYHDEVRWEESTVDEELIDQRMKHQFNKALNNQQRVQGLLQGARQKLTVLEEKKARLARDLAEGIADFEQHAALRPYRNLVVHQIDIIRQAIEAFADEDDQEERHQFLKKTLADLEKRLNVVSDVLASSAEQTHIAQGSTPSKL